MSTLATEASVYQNFNNKANSECGQSGMNTNMGSDMFSYPHYLVLVLFYRQNTNILKTSLMYRTEQIINCITLKLLQCLVTLHTYTTIYNFVDKTGHNNNG